MVGVTGHGPPVTVELTYDHDLVVGRAFADGELVGQTACSLVGCSAEKVRALVLESLRRQVDDHHPRTFNRETIEL